MSERIEYLINDIHKRTEEEIKKIIEDVIKGENFTYVTIGIHNESEIPIFINYIKNYAKKYCKIKSQFFRNDELEINFKFQIPIFWFKKENLNKELTKKILEKEICNNCNIGLEYEGTSYNEHAEPIFEEYICPKCKKIKKFNPNNSKFFYKG